MSWDASLSCPTCGCSLCGREWNYTHNTNGMASAAVAGTAWDLGGMSWWRYLDGMVAADAGPFLAAIVSALEAEPDRFRAMNPENGWGSYDTLLPTLRSMRDACEALPGGTWEAHG